MKKFRKKRGFHKKRGFRLSDENYADLKKLKKGTWNYLFAGLIKTYEKAKGKTK